MKWKQFLRFFNNWEGKAKTQMGHSYEAFTYLFGRNIFIHLLSANNNFPIDLLKLAITGNFGSIVDPWTQTIYFFPKLAGNFIVESRINPWLPVTAILKGLQKNFCLLRAGKLRYFGQTNRDAYAIWVKNLGTIHGDVQPNCFLPWQTTNVKSYCSMVKCLN